MAELTIAQVRNALKERCGHYCVQIMKAEGSTPRNAGAMMLVGADDVFGTIGGGSAEWAAIESARRMIGGGETIEHQEIVLGPEIDQCCGGKIYVRFLPLDANTYESIIAGIGQRTSENVIIFGAGHTGMALANALGVVGMAVTLIDSRREYEAVAENFNFHCLSMPEAAVRQAPPNSIFIITTHDHSLDFLITAEALARTDARYVGMIGSKTKRAVLKSWMGDNGYSPNSIEVLCCPIGGTCVKDKKPEIIAAMCVAEILSTIEPA